MPIVPKFQTCKCGEQVPTQFQIKGDEVEYPGMHICARGHAMLTRLDPKRGEPTINTADVRPPE